MMEYIAPIASVIMSGISILSVIYLGAVKLAKLEVKVDTMWDFQMRRAFSEAVKTGVATMNSPLHFDQEVRENLAPIRDELQQFWKTHHTVPMLDFIIMLETKFGDQLLKEICIPRGLSHGACLLVALAVARGVDTIDLEDLKSGLVFH